MQENKLASRSGWETLTTGQLEDLLRRELEKTPPDDDTVLALLHLLEARKTGELPEVVAQPRKKNGHFRHWVAAAASLVLILGMLAVILPQQAEAETLFQMLSRWTSDFFQLFSTDAENNQKNGYVFETDNPGLQEVYEAVRKLGITDPVVPTWLPEGSELVELKVNEFPTYMTIQSRFEGDQFSMVFIVNLVDSVKASDYYREDEEPIEHERDGIVHSIMKNKEIWTVVWTRDRIECSIMLDCQEDTMYRILDSIYVMEDYE